MYLLLSDKQAALVHHSVSEVLHSLITPTIHHNTGILFVFKDLLQTFAELVVQPDVFVSESLFAVDGAATQQHSAYTFHTCTCTMYVR